jgi:hypothetical protein
MLFREHTSNGNHVSYPETFFSCCKKAEKIFTLDEANVRLRVVVYYLRDFSLV